MEKLPACNYDPELDYTFSNLSYNLSSKIFPQYDILIQKVKKDTYSQTAYCKKPKAIRVKNPGMIFYFFGFMMILQLIFVLRMMPETKGIALEDMKFS